MVVAGKIIRFDEVRGYGFIAPDSGGEDVFMHVNDVELDKRMITPGMSVEFIIENGERGLKASRVRAAGTAPVRPAVTASAPDDDDSLCDVLSVREFIGEVTEALLESVPTLNAEQIVRARQCLVQLGRSHGWVEE